MEDARDYINIYANLRDQTLERKTFDLFRAILRSLGHIMKFFAEGSIRKPHSDTGTLSIRLVCQIAR